MAIFGSQQYVKPRFTLKMNVFTSKFLEPYKCVLKPSEQGLFFQDNRFEV